MSEPFDPDNDELDQTVRRVDPDRWLASRFIGDRAERADVIAVYAFDHQLARASLVANNGLIAEMRLVWWREAVDEIFTQRLVRRHPVAQALGKAVARRDLAREPLEAMIEARIAALGKSNFNLDAARAWADAVAGSAMILAARVLDAAAPADALGSAGRAWGLTLLRRSGAAISGTLDKDLAVSLRRASHAGRGLSAAAFPAVAFTTLAWADLSSRAPGEFEKRLRLLWSVARGRI